MTRAALVLVVVCAPGVAHGWEVDFLGPAREISHSSSASRDTGVLGVVAKPRRILSGGGDFGLFRLRGAGATLRVGGFGMLELESQGESRAVLPFPQGDIHYWRGLYGLGAALSFDRAARRWLGDRGALETTLTLRHESEHYTGNSDGGAGSDYSAVPHIGDFVMLDAAARVPAGSLDVIVRVQHKLFVPDHSGYSHGPGADVIVRWRGWRRAHPFSSTFAEYLFGADRFPDAYLVRNLSGVILPSNAGDLYLFVSADVGHRKGLAVFTEEATLGFGARFAFY